MSNTTFSIELQGLNLPDEVKDKLQSDLRSVVLAEIAKTDLGKEVSVKPLPDSSERVFSHISPILGFVIQNLGKLAERSSIPQGPSLLFTPPDSVKKAQAMFGPAATSRLPFDGAPPADVIEALYYRPDIRAAIVANSRAFVELLSRDEQASRVYSQLTAGIRGPTEDAERYGVAIAVLVGGLLIGAALGWASRPK